MTTIEPGFGPQALAATTPDGPAFADLLANDAVQVAGSTGFNSSGAVWNLLDQARSQLGTARADVNRALAFEDAGQLDDAYAASYDALDSLYAVNDTLGQLEHYNLTDAQRDEAASIKATADAMLPHVQNISNSIGQDLVTFLLSITAGLNWLLNAGREYR